MGKDGEAEGLGGHNLNVGHLTDKVAEKMS
jgi:hypothetical protein